MSVDSYMERLSASKWKTSLGKALVEGLKIANDYEEFAPAAHVLKGAVTFGSLLLNPDSSLENLQKECDALYSKLEKLTSSVTSSDQNPKLKERVGNKLKSKIEKIEEKMADPPNEIYSDFEKANAELEKIRSELIEANETFEKDITPIKDLINKTYSSVSDQGYKV